MIIIIKLGLILLFVIIGILLYPVATTSIYYGISVWPNKGAWFPIVLGGLSCLLYLYLFVRIIFSIFVKKRPLSAYL